MPKLRLARASNNKSNTSGSKDCHKEQVASQKNRPFNNKQTQHTKSLFFPFFWIQSIFDFMPEEQPSYEVNVWASDMPDDMKNDAVEICVQAVKSETSESRMASQIKKKFDELYPEVKWHCLVGRAYGSYLTHDPRSFLHVSVGKEVIILFRAS
eukprot:Gregarina_sp_Pseudo_9__1028@NODE_1665_length_1414_cov_78_373818_g1543_i0_p1_GENE_NODE_1665_length_1414_cov_78_373818_g1543_i0NODE_1665_length_1414_cov_78_373818_g1543_i0_p1_ORF_typecomplete_len154_score17_28Dynein_light/PF01221_18/1_1e23_NODE_1665_length_1414_cov_78_373818_g1543_i0278739